MTNDPYGPPDDRPNLQKRPEQDAPAGLGDPPQQSGWGDPAAGQSGWGDPAAGQSGWGDPAAGQSGWGDPGSSQSSYGQPGYGQPGYGSSGYSQPAHGQSGYAQPYPDQPYGAQPPPYGSPPPYAPMYSPYPPPSRTNGLAIAALITGLCGFFCLTGLAAIGLGIAGLGESRRSGVGRGMAIAGLVLGAAWTLLFIGLILVTALTTN